MKTKFVIIFLFVCADEMTSVLTTEEISSQKLAFIRGRKKFSTYSFQMLSVPSLFKAFSPRVKSTHIKVVKALEITVVRSQTKTAVGSLRRIFFRADRVIQREGN